MSHGENTGRALLNNAVQEHQPRQVSLETMNDREVLTHLSKMNIILLGIPGAGKTTLSEELMSRHPDIDYVSLGDISRNLTSGSPEQLYLEQLFQGEAPTGDPGFFLGLIESRIDTAREQGHGFILDGVPKKASEVQPLLDFFESKDLAIDAVISCEASPLETYNRIAARDSRPGSEDSMAVFLNRTKIYLTDIDSFKDRLTADGAHLFTLDTEMLNQQQSVSTLLDLTRIALSKSEIMQPIGELEAKQSVETVVNEITTLLAKSELDGVDRKGEIAALLSSHTLDIALTVEDTEALTEYSCTGDDEILVSIAERHLNRLLPDSDYPLTNEKITSNFIASGLQPLFHLSDSLIEEVRSSDEPLDVAVDRLVRLQLACSSLLSEKYTRTDIHSLTENELQRNSDALRSLERIAAKEGIQLDADYLMKIQPAVFEMLTSNDPITTVDVNYRKRLNSRAGAARSLQAPERPDQDKLVSRYGDYIDFIEATAATKRGGYASTFGFLHKVQTDGKGNPYIIEYPHTMFERDILEIDHPITEKLMRFEDDFQRTHDMLHNALPVYAEHFMIHHPTAPITLGGYLPEYEAFGKGMRKDKSSYELGLAILHKQIMQDRFSEDPSLLEHHTAAVAAILDDLVDMQQREVCDDKIIDHVSFVTMTAAMNILPYNSSAYQALLAKYDKISLPSTEVFPRDIYKLLIQQEATPVDASLVTSMPTGTSKDKAITQVCRSVDDSIAIANLQNLELDYTEAEQGAECIVDALKEMGLDPNGFTSSVVLQGRNRLRWTSIAASSRRLKGFNEKIHGLDTVRFWNENTGQFDDATPVSLMGRFHDHFKENMDEYNYRMWFRGLSNATLQEFKGIATDQGVSPEVGDAVASSRQQVVDYCIRNLIDDDYQPIGATIRHELIRQLAASNDDATSKTINCLKAYETLVHEATQATKRNGNSFKDARELLTRKLMSLDG